MWVEGYVDCEHLLGGDAASSEVNLTAGPIYDTDGQKYERVMDSEGGTPLLCPDCWEAREAERRQGENASLKVF